MTHPPADRHTTTHTSADCHSAPHTLADCHTTTNPPADRHTATRQPAGHRAATPGPARPRPPVYLWVDSFSAGFAGSPAPAAARLLAHAGYDPRPLPESVCCGLTWITTGQLGAAARRLQRALDVLAPIADAGLPIVGLEPSCLAVWRSDAARLVSDPRLPRVARRLRTLAEFLTACPDWRPPDLTGLTVVAQPHCHHQAVLGWAADAALLARTGAAVVTVDGCCGLAGDFGVVKGHYDVSTAVARSALLPALAAHPDAVVLADGFSCRAQVADLTGRRALTLAELLDDPPRPTAPG
jgi:Fe-S oxidoreductase